MSKAYATFITAAASMLLLSTVPAAAALTPKQIVDKLLEHDFWGLSGAELTATVELKDKKGRTRTLAFEGASRAYKGHLTKSMVRFLRPPDLAGAGFLQIQNDDRDDDRFLYLPALKRSRRVAASQRSTAFMGTDFNFADMDRRDIREGSYRSGQDTKIGKYDCYQITVKPRREDSPYSRLELAVRKDNFIPLKVRMFDKAGVHVKTLSVFKLKKIGNQWFITRSKMVNHKENHQTTLVLEKIRPADDIPDSRFTRQKLER